MNLIEQIKRQIKLKVIDCNYHKSNNCTIRWLNVGILEILPLNANIDKAIILSAGDDGEDLTSINILDKFLKDFFCGTVKVKSALIILLVNPEAMLARVKFIASDINKMFSKKYLSYAPSYEKRRAEIVENSVKTFFSKFRDCTKLHIHLSIRDSSFDYEKFTLLTVLNQEPNIELLDFFKTIDSKIELQAADKTGSFCAFTANIKNVTTCKIYLQNSISNNKNTYIPYHQTILLINSIVQ